MGKKKIYAAKFIDGTTGTYASWDECSQAVTGVKGVLYKGFESQHEAMSWLAGLERVGHGDRIEGYRAYVDGSFGKGSDRAGWGYVIVLDELIIHEDNGLTDDPALSRNIDGECVAAAQATSYCIENGLFPLTIIHDYIGLSMWATRQWEARTPISIWYQEVMDKFMRYHDIQFRHIRGHQGNVWNEYADILAKRARTQGGDQ